MSVGWENPGTSTLIYKDLSGSDPSKYSIFYQAKGAINTDGAPKSYHPDDPRGEKNLALNTVVNAMEPRPYNRKEKRSIPCPKGGEGSCYSQWVAAFDNAKAFNFSVSAEWWVRFSDIIPSIRTGLGEDIPCIQGKDSLAPGYYVSATHATWSRGDKCDQSIYVDAGLFNGNVLPGKSAWGRLGRPTDSFDLVVMMVDGGEPIYAINFDSGPEKEIGEVSIAAAAALKGVRLTDYRNYEAIKSLALEHVNYLVFPEVDVKRTFKGRFTQQQLNEFGAEVFEAWGGVDRLSKCGLLPQFRSGR
jgi:hypothetical protein